MRYICRWKSLSIWNGMDEGQWSITFWHFCCCRYNWIFLYMRHEVQATTCTCWLRRHSCPRYHSRVIWIFCPLNLLHSPLLYIFTAPPALLSFLFIEFILFVVISFCWPLLFYIFTFLFKSLLFYVVPFCTFYFCCCYYIVTIALRYVFIFCTLHYLLLSLYLCICLCVCMWHQVEGKCSWSCCLDEWMKRRTYSWFYLLFISVPPCCAPPCRRCMRRTWRVVQ